MNPTVAVVILNWNGKKFLERFLPSVLASTYSSWKLVVIDNASTDESVAFLEKEYPQVQLVLNSNNEGFAGGYNKGLKAVQADYYVLLNSDVEVEPGWLEPMVALLENDATIAACQPSMQQYDNHQIYEYAGAAGGWLDCLGYPFAMGRIFEHCEPREGQFEKSTPIFWASGAALFIRSSVYWEVNGLDESFFAHQEEIDLCWRIQWAGYKIYSCPSAVVYHVGGGTLPKGHSRKTFLNFRNNLRMLWKNLPWWRALPVLGIRFGLDAVFAWYSLLKGDAVSFGAVAKAHMAFFLWLLGKKQRQWFPTKKNEAWDGFYKGSVLWKYHVARKNKFLEIVKNFR